MLETITASSVVSSDVADLVPANNRSTVNVTVTAAATLPTTFMRLANFTDLQVTSTGEATRRMVDLSLMLDVSSSIGSSWSSISSAATQFINGFDPAHDRFALGTYGWGVEILDQMQSSRGFNKAAVIADVPTSLPGGTTPMAEGVYRAWDELRTVSSATQSSLRVIVLFTDGSGNNFPGNFDGSGISKGLFVNDFPAVGGTTSNTPQLAALYNEATVGLCLSLTNFSLMPKEMLACGLPCVELAGVSAESIFGENGPLDLTPLQPQAIADALERLLSDRERWERRSREGIEFVAPHTWEHATDEVEAGLRHALRERELAQLDVS